MRAVRASERGVAVVNVAPPKGEGVRVRVAAAGICGSDLHLQERVRGVTLGHEIAGRTDDGTPVAVEPLSPCRRCAPCKSGAYNLCARGAAMIHGVALDGGMADALRVPAAALVPLPRGVRLRDACLIEPLAVAVHALRRARLRAGERVLVVGGGAIGLCALAAARATGAEVTLLARHESQREAATRLGAQVEIPTPDNEVRAPKNKLGDGDGDKARATDVGDGARASDVDDGDGHGDARATDGGDGHGDARALNGDGDGARVTNGHGDGRAPNGGDDKFDLVLEAAGSESALAVAAARARAGGRIGVLGSYWQPVALPGFALCMGEISLIPASLYGRAGRVRDIEVAAQVLAQNSEIARTLITHRFPLDAAPEAFATAAKRDAGAIKVVLEPDT